MELIFDCKGCAWRLENAHFVSAFAPLFRHPVMALVVQYIIAPIRSNYFNRL